MPVTEQKLDAAISSIADDLRPIVQDIESGIKTTQNHYGRYMDILTQVGEDANTKRLIALALREAGANEAGVLAAMKIHGI
jgi:hypothetical protein